MILLSRDDFRAQVFARDRNRCVCCGRPGQDAHHILERRLFPDGGYYLANGATLCGPCHLKAESTELSCDEIRVAAGICEAVLPPHLYHDERYDKWGNIILPTGRRLKGELFDDPAVQKILAPVLHLFDNRVKYPRTWHLPCSPGVTKDDRVLAGHIVESWVDTDVVITEKMDGEKHDHVPRLHSRPVHGVFPTPVPFLRATTARQHLRRDSGQHANLWREPVGEAFDQVHPLERILSGVLDLGRYPLPLVG